jgi:hypothetical protein
MLRHAPCFLTRAKYARLIRSIAPVLLLCVILFLAGCGESGGTPTAAVEPTTTVTTTDAVSSLQGAGTTAVAESAHGAETALLERVDVGRHEGYDRVVFQFRNDLPGYRVQYVEPPLREDGSGKAIAVDGGAVVLVRMEPASGFDLSTGEGELVYKGPRRLEGSAFGTDIVVELVRTGDFEAVLSWAVGLDKRVDFRVRTATSPARLIVDFRNT